MHRKVRNRDGIIETRRLHFIGAAYINGFFWTSALEWNGYYRINIETGKAECLGIFQYMDVWEDKLFNQVLDYQKFVFFIPWFSNYLVRLNTENLNIKYWKLPENIIPEIAKFRAANIYANKIFMFPHCGDDICIFNIQTEEFECDQNWLDAFLKNVKWNKNDKFIQGLQKEDNVWLANLSGNFMMKYNLITYQLEMILFPESEGKIMDITEHEENNLLVLTSLGNVWEYNINNCNKKLIYKYSGNLKEPYRHILVIKDNFYLIPEKNRKIEKFNKMRTEMIEYPSDWKLQYVYVGMETVFNGYFLSGEKALLYPCLGNKLLVLNNDSLTGITIYEDIESREKEIRRFLRANPINGKVVYERNIDLEKFLNVFVERENKRNAENSFNVGGKHIWNIMKGW